MTTTILVIDDSEDDQRLYQRAFKDFDDFRLVMASSAEAGFARISDAKPDMILLDYNLPDMDGLSFIKKLSEYSDTPIPVIMLTVEGNAAVAVEAMKNGVDDYIVKDTDGRYLRLLPGVAGHVMAAHAQREQAMQLWREKELLLLRNQAFMQNATEGIHVMDLRGNLVEANDAFCRMLGYTQKEMAQLNVADWDAQWSAAELDVRLKSHLVKNARFETVHRRKDGSLINVEVSTSGMEFEEQYLIFATSHDITARKRDEEKLKLGTQLLDSTSDTVFLFDLDGNFIYLNEAAWKSRGYTRDEMMAMNLRELNTPEFREILAPRIKEVLKKGHGIFESAHRCKDGSIMPVEISSRVIESGGRQLLLAVIRDITERKKTEEALRVAAVTFETHDAIIITDADGNIIQVNRAFSDITGYSAEEVLGQNPRIMSSGRHGRIFYADMWQQLLHAGTWSGEIWDKRKNGEIFPKWMTITAVKNERQETIRYISISSDITARVHAEEALLRESDERFRGTLEQAAVGIAHADLDGTYQQVNQKLCEILGYSPTELIRLNVQEVTFPDDLDKDSVLMQQILTGEIPTFAVEKRYVRKNQTLVWVNLTISLLHKTDGSPKYFIFVVEDITERKATEHELGESRQLLRDMVVQGEALREEERKHIAREIHDELGQVLTSLRIDVGLLRLRFGVQNPALLEKAQEITVLLDRAIQGVRNVASNLRPAALDVGIVSAIEWLSDEFTKHTGVPCVVRLTKKHIDMNETLAVVVFRIVQESLTNVARYAEASSVEITLAQGADVLHVIVCDNGRGFDSTNNNNRKSFGLLGMRERAMALGGTVEIVSAPQQGTVVSVRIPTQLNGDTL